MWIFTNDGFISVVQNKDNINHLVVRARKKDHLGGLYNWSGEEVIETDDSDYRFRIIIDRQDFSSFVQEHVDRINYTNFKASVPKSLYERLLHEVWFVMRKLQKG